MSEQLSYLEVVERQGRALVHSGFVNVDEVDALREDRPLEGRGMRLYAVGSRPGVFGHLIRVVPELLRQLVSVNMTELPRGATTTLANSVLRRNRVTHWAALGPNRRQWRALDAAAAETVIYAWTRGSAYEGLLVETDAAPEAIESLLDDLVEEAPAAAAALPADTDASAAKRAELLQEGWPDSIAVSTLLRGGTAPSNPSQYAAKLRRQGRLLGVRVPGENTIRHPACQFHNEQLLPVVADLLALLPRGNGSGWSQAFWLYSPHPLLDGERPADLLADDPGRVLDAAQEQFGEDADDAGR